MSNGEDVLDSWEEIDEAELEKSLKFNKTVKEQQTVILKNYTTDSENFGQMKLLLRPTTDAAGSNAANAENESLSSLDTMAESFKPVIMMLNKTNDEYQSVNYTAPIANQTVKILRRPTGQGDRRNGTVKPKQPIKTLQQREQEYAEARLRIMGAAKNPDDDLANLEKQKKSTAALNNVKPATTTEMPTISTRDKQDTDKSLPTYAYMDNSVTGPTAAAPPPSPYVANFSKTNFMPPPPTQNYGYAPCADVYGNRAMTMLGMPPPQPPLLSAQTYPHLNTGLFPLHQQNRQFQKQYSLPNQQKTWALMAPSGGGGGGNNGAGNGIGISANHSKLLQQQQQQQKAAYLKTQNNNKTNYQNQQQQLQQQQQYNNTTQNESILRLPRGPDGHGFQMRR